MFLSHDFNGLLKIFCIFIFQSLNKFDRLPDHEAVFDLSQNLFIG